jgi:hypothetical protein
VNSQTDSQTGLAGLDFDIPCAVRWGSPDNDPCGHTAIADVSFIDGNGSTVTRFLCAECVDSMISIGRLVNVTYI